MQTTEEVAEQIAHLARKLEKLRLASETVSTVPTVPVAEGKTILEARPAPEEDFRPGGVRNEDSLVPCSR